VSSHFYQFQRLGDDDEELEFVSTDYPPGENTLAYFKPRELTNLELVDQMESTCPLISAKVSQN
jgi:splicing factor 3B subunit 3